MNVTFHTPGDIEGESMRIIQQELDEMGATLEADCADVVRRAIHTTADFDYAKNLVFTPGAASAGVAALRAANADCYRHQHGPLRHQPKSLCPVWGGAAVLHGRPGGGPGRES